MKSTSARKIDTLLFLVIYAAYLAATLFLFHRQTVNYAGMYNSDISVYVSEIQGIETIYDFPYPVMFAIAKLFLLVTTPQHAMAFAVTLLNGLSPLILKYFLDRRLRGEGKAEERSPQLVKGLFTTLASFSMMLVSMLYSLSCLGVREGADQIYRYKGVYTPNPYHNATYLAARPFAIIAFFLLADILLFYETEKKFFHWKYLMFSIFLFVSTMTKPSFTLAAVGMAGLIMLWRLGKSRFQNWRAFFSFGIYFIPTFLALLYQYGGVFANGTQDAEKGMGIGILTAWSTASDHVALSILLGIAFPLTVLLFQFRRVWQNNESRLSWQLYGMSLIMLMLLYEKGYRLPHVNFAWGYMYGMFFLFLTSLTLLIRNSISQKQAGWKLGIQWAVFTLHMICGIDYFLVLLDGGLFL